MSNSRIILKKSSVVDKEPVLTDLEYGEIALNYTDGKLFYKDNVNSLQSFQILPNQTGNTGKYLTTDGTDTSWAPSLTVGLTDLGISDGTSGQLLTTDGAGNFTFADAPVSLPDQTGNTGKYLTTDGSTASWVDVATGLTWTSSTSAPTVGVKNGDRWYDTSDGTLHEYVSDGTTQVWIETSGSNIEFIQDTPVLFGAVPTSIIPDTDVAYDLGSSTHRWKDLWLSGNTIYVGNAIISTDTVTGTIAISSPPTAEYPDPQAFVITASGTSLSTSTIGGVVDFEAVAVELETNPGFDGAYSSLSGTPTIPSDVSDLTDTSNLLDHFSGAYGDLTNAPSLATVATSGSFNDLLDQPAPFNPNTLATVATSGSYNDLSNLPSLFDGAYASLTGLPSIPSIAGLATETFVGTAVSNLVASAPGVLDTLNELAAALGNDENFATTVSTSIGLKANTADLSTVATTGAYSDLSGTPTIPADLTDLSISDGTSGQLLTTDGAGGFTFADAPVSLPDQTGNTGKYLTTDGTNATWVDVATGITWTSSTSSPTVDVKLGDRWYQTSTGKVYEYMSDGVTSIWIETSGIDIEITTEPSGGGGVTTYATLPELGAAANVAGSMGYVTANGNFYTNDGTGWSKITSTFGTEPDAPTMVSATVVNDTSAYVTVTSPTYTGGLPITSYIITSSPGGITSTIDNTDNTFPSGYTGNIDIVNLTGGTTYTFTITATNSAGTSLPSAASNSITTDETLIVGQRAIFGYGQITDGSGVAITNLVSNTGVVANDTTGVGTSRYNLAAASYGTDKAMFGYGYTGSNVSMTNLVSNTGVVSGDTTGVGTARAYLAAAGYGGDKAIFGYGGTVNGGGLLSTTNKVSNTGVVSADTTGVGTAREFLAAAGYGGDKAIFGYGYTTTYVSMTNKVSNTGVVSADTTGVGTSRYNLAAAGYGGDKAIFGYGRASTGLSLTNLVSNTGVVATDTTGVGTGRPGLAAAGYGEDKAIFGYGYSTAYTSITNLVSNTGVVAANTTGVGTARAGLAAAGF